MYGQRVEHHTDGKTIIRTIQADTESLLLMTSKVTLELVKAKVRKDISWWNESQYGRNPGSFLTTNLALLPVCMSATISLQQVRSLSL
mmetsp:Transcript_32220/g.47609  ORF Transcript_32220/g.47609 Transcript_32220/m.47609 type:complete len:88 (+) Transcript_32220:1492-1755(+)